MIGGKVLGHHKVQISPYRFADSIQTTIECLPDRIVVHVPGQQLAAKALNTLMDHHFVRQGKRYRFSTLDYDTTIFPDFNGEDSETEFVITYAADIA